MGGGGFQTVLLRSDYLTHVLFTATNYIPPKSIQKMKRIIVTPFSSDGSPFGCDKSYLWFDNLTQLCTHEYPLKPEDQINCDAYAGGPLVLEFGDV